MYSLIRLFIILLFMRSIYILISLPPRPRPPSTQLTSTPSTPAQLVAVYEVLKNPEKRKTYDSVLREGLPDWRQPVYYYRKARKLGNSFSVGHGPSFS